MNPVIALVGLAIFMWIVAIWATFEESEDAHDVKKPDETSPGAQDKRNAA